MPIFGKTIAKELGEMLPGIIPSASYNLRTRNLAQKILTPRPRSPGGIVAAGIGARKAVNPLGAVAVSAGLAGTGTGAIYLSQNEPEQIGADIANMQLGVEEGIEMLKQKAVDFAEVPQLYFLKLRRGYYDEMRRQEELKNLQEFGTFEKPEVILESGEIVPVFQAGDVADRSRIEKMKRNLQHSLDQLSGSEDGMGNDDLYVRNRLFNAGFDYEDMDNEEINRLLEMGMTPDQVANYIITVGPAVDVARPTRIYPEFTKEERMNMLAAGQGMPGVYLDSSSFNLENFPRIQTFVDRMRKKPIEKKDGDEVKKQFPNKGLEALYASGQKGRDAVEAMGYQAGDEVMSEGKSGEDIQDDLKSMQMSEDDAMNEMNQLVQSPEVQMIEQLVQVVQQLMAQGVSEAEIKMFLKEQGLDDEDIQALFQMIAESSMQQEGASIDQQLAGMM